jgi:hypothetical protein
MIEAMAQFGVAGLMGALWVWERGYSRRREQQLTAAHERLTRSQEHLRVMIHTVRRNTEALIEFERTQRRLGEILEAIRHAITQNHRAA